MAVLPETGPLALSVPLTLTRFDGTVLPVRGSIADLAQSQGQLEGVFSRSGTNAWVRDLAEDPEHFEFCTVTVDHVSTHYRILDREAVSSALHGSVDNHVTRFELVQPATDVPGVGGDFDPDDFDSADFFTGAAA